MENNYTRRAMIGEQQWHYEISMPVDNGVTYRVADTTAKHVCVIEHIDLTHPDCPVVCLGSGATFIEQRYKMSPMEFREKFGQPEQPSQPE